MAVGALVLFVLAVAWPAVSTNAAPYEDAAMLMRYAVNLASGHGIVWNPGEAPIDGATDLGFMVVLAGLVRAGMAVERGARALDLVGFLATVVGCYLFARRFHRAGVVLSVLVAGFLALGPAVAYTSAAFAAPFFGMGVAGVVVAAGFVRRFPNRTAAALGLGVAIVGAGLVRPEGFLIGACCAGGVLVSGGRRVVRSVGVALAVAVAGGLVFVAGRWWYFGAPLPNPYYKKGGEQLHVDAFVRSLETILDMTWPLLAVAFLGLVPRRSRRDAAGLLCTVGSFALLWLLISDEMNYWGRFQYPALVILAFGVPGVATELGRTLAARRREGASPWLVPVAGLVSLAVGLTLVSADYPSRHWSEPPQLAVAQVLAAEPHLGHSVVTTEAGLIALRGRWPVLDAWGLNDAEIAHHGVVTVARLEAVRPGVVFVHAPTTPDATTIHPDGHRFLPGWSAMTDVLIRYSEDRRYVLAAAFANDRDPGSWAVYVRPGMPHTRRIVRSLAGLDIPGFTNVAAPGDSLPTGGGPRDEAAALRSRAEPGQTPVANATMRP